MKKNKTIEMEHSSTVVGIECKICHNSVTGGVLSVHGPICHGCAETIRRTNMEKKLAKNEGKAVKGKKAPKPVTLREKGIGPNLCINIPIIKENKALIDGIGVFRTAYGISLNNLLFLALGRHLGITVKFN